MSKRDLAPIKARYEVDASFDALRSAGSRYVEGRGNTKNPTIMIIGEAPGKEENSQGIPFVGDSGRVLDKWMKLARFSEDDVYITNVVKYRPILIAMGMKSNRTPTLKEVNDSIPYLIDEWKILGFPSVIIPCGRVATQAVVDDNYAPFYTQGILKLVDTKTVINTSKFHVLSGSPVVIPSVHPSFVLRNQGKANKYEDHWRWIGEYIGGKSK